MYDVITIGSATVDVFAHTSNQLVKFITPSHEQNLIAYPSGSKILVSELDFLIGGGGTNTAVSFSRLGLHTAFAGKIGDDENGYRILHALDTDGVDFVGSKQGQSGYSIVLDSIEHDRTILTYKGANNNLREDELTTATSKWLYISSMMDISFQSTIKLAQKLHEKGTKIAFNPSNYQTKLGMMHLSELLRITDVLILNKEEAQSLLGKTAESSVLATLLATHCGPYVIVTDGKRGAWCYYDKTIYEITPSPGQAVVESTGAGDAFASGFVAAIIKNLPLQESLQTAMKQAQGVIGFPGAKKGLLEWNDLVTKEFKGSVQIYPAPSALADNIILPETNKAEPFIFANGKQVSNLEELAYYLKFISETIYSKHLHDYDNDYALWIEHTHKNVELANKIRVVRNQFLMSEILLDYIHKVKK